MVYKHTEQRRGQEARPLEFTEAGWARFDAGNLAAVFGAAFLVGYILARQNTTESTRAILEDGGHFPKYFSYRYLLKPSPSIHN